MSGVRLLNYTVTDKIDERTHTVLYRAKSNANQNKVILKTIPGDYPDLDASAALQYEYYLLKKIDLEGIVHAQQYVKQNDRHVLVLENIEGITLKKFLSGNPINLKDFFKISMQLIKIIGALHQQHIVHKDINPNNIMVDPNTLKITIFDLNISTELSNETQKILNTSLLQGSLPYISPEQTGRLNRLLDFRTDFYSLGVTFFEILTGRLPFQSKDALEIVYSHLAELPPNLQEINPQVPAVLAAIVGKLLAKMPEDRYQTASGLLHDLNECAKQWESTENIIDFPFGKADVSDQLILSQKLYGRDVEINQLLEAFERVSNGPAELLLISGYTGIGKTSLVKELFKPITNAHGYFISGKYDQLRRSTPYSAIINAFQELIKILLAEPEEKLVKIKNELLKALGNNGHVIAKVIPNITSIIGEQEPTAALSPLEEQNRFTLTFQNLIETLANPEHPLVLFLDDLQWVDSASLQLIHSLLIDKELKNFLLICAYRDNEVTPDHPFMNTISKLEQLQTKISALTLTPLTQQNINEMLADTLNTNESNIKTLSNLIFTKTRGNPFFVNEFLKKIYQDKLLKFSHADKEWQWSIDKINQKQITANVVDLLTAKIQKLPDKTQKALQLAACVGHIFDLDALLIISELSLQDLINQFVIATHSGFIEPLDDSYRIEGLSENDTILKQINLKKISYQFVHDRIQQAAYHLIPKSERQQLHLKIGRLILKDHELQENDENLFKVLDHFNQSLALIGEPAEKLKLAKYNLWAGQKAKTSMAYASAINYFNAGLSLLQPLDWQKNYDLLFHLDKELATCLYLTGEFSQVQTIFEELLPNVKDNVDKFQLYKLYCEMLATQRKHSESIIVGVTALKLIHIHLPLKPNTLDALLALFKTKFKTGRKIRDIELSPINSKLHLEAAKLIAQLCNSAYFVDQKMLVLLTCELVNISLKYGYFESTPTFLLSYAFIIMHALGWYNEGKDFVYLHEKIKKNYVKTPFDGRNHVLLGTCLEPWYKTLSACIETIYEGYPCAYEAGDLIYSAHSMTTLISTIFFSGQPLVDVEKEIRKTRVLLDRIKMSDTKNIVLSWNYAVQCLQGYRTFSNEQMRVYEQNNIADKNKTQLSYFYCLAAKLNYLFDDYDSALENSLKHLKYAEFSLGSITPLEGSFYYAMALCASKNAYPVHHKKIKKIIKQFERWSSWQKANYEHYLLLLQAEYARIQHKTLDAMKYYDRVIQLATEQKVLPIAAIAYECAGKFYQTLGQHISAKVYIQNAHYTFKRWGSDAKCELIEHEYPEWIHLRTEESKDNATNNNISTNKLDMLSIVKATQSISHEMDYTKLLTALIKTLVENAGAQNGMLLLNKSDQWILAVELRSAKNEVSIPNLPIEQCDLPLTLIHYVQRTNDPVLLTNAADSQFKSDNYVMLQQPKAILCMPIMRQNETIAILYLENNATVGAFTKEHLTSLKLLAGQVAISMENSLLYDAGQRFVPFEFLTQLNKRNLADVALGDHIQKQLSVLFCDIQGFTMLSEALSAADNFKFINEFLGNMEPIITNNKGFIDKYIGDAIMALFEQQADHAVFAAIMMQRKLKEMNKKRLFRYQKPLRIGIGINTGELMLGIIGSSHHLENSVIGDSVNIAAHIEHLTRKFDVDLLISGNTKAKLTHPENFQMRLIASVSLKGKVQQIDIWEVCNANPKDILQQKMLTLNIFNQALEAYQHKNFINAEKLFAEVLQQNPNDGVAKFYFDKCVKRKNKVNLK